MNTGTDAAPFLYLDGVNLIVFLVKINIKSISHLANTKIYLYVSFTPGFYTRLLEGQGKLLVDKLVNFTSAIIDQIKFSPEVKLLSDEFSPNPYCLLKLIPNT